MSEIAFGFLKLRPRPEKPRKKGIFIGCLEFFLTLSFIDEFLEVNHSIVDLVKVQDIVGLTTRYPFDWLKRKNNLYAKYKIPTFLGGVTFELAYLQNKVDEYFNRCVDLGFSGFELSEDVIPNMAPEKRAGLIRRAMDVGLMVFTEIGKKRPTEPLGVDQAVREIKADLDAGSEMVTIEIGELKLLRQMKKDSVLVDIVKQVGIENVLFELDYSVKSDELDKEYLLYLINMLGPDVNVENVRLIDCTMVEALRRGLSVISGMSFLAEGAKA